MRGRKPSSKKLRVSRKRVVGVRAPRSLKGEALAEWKRIVPLIIEAGIVVRLDERALSLYCECWAQFVRARDAMAETGTSYRTDDGLWKRHPDAATVSDCLKMLRGYLSEFGLTPLARLRVKPEGETSKKDQDATAKRLKFFGERAS